MAANYNKRISDTSIRLGLVRFGYVHVFAPRKNEDGTDGKYSVQLLIPKKDTQAKALTLELTIDTEISSVMDYFEIFMTRMLLCRKAAEYFGLKFRLVINGSAVL